MNAKRQYYGMYMFVIIWENNKFSIMLTFLNGTSIGRKLDTQRNDEVDVILIKYVTRLHV